MASGRKEADGRGLSAASGSPSKAEALLPLSNSKYSSAFGLSLFRYLSFIMDR